MTASNAACIAPIRRILHAGTQGDLHYRANHLVGGSSASSELMEQALQIAIEMRHAILKLGRANLRGPSEIAIGR